MVFSVEELNRVYRQVLRGTSDAVQGSHRGLYVNHALALGSSALTQQALLGLNCICQENNKFALEVIIDNAGRLLAV